YGARAPPAAAREMTHIAPRALVFFGASGVSGGKHPPRAGGGGGKKLGQQKNGGGGEEEASEKGCLEIQFTIPVPRFYRQLRLQKGCQRLLSARKFLQFHDSR